MVESFMGPLGSIHKQSLVYYSHWASRLDFTMELLVPEGGPGFFLPFRLMNGSTSFFGRGGATGRVIMGGLCKRY